MSKEIKGILEIPLRNKEGQGGRMFTSDHHWMNDIEAGMPVVRRFFEKRFHGNSEDKKELELAKLALYSNRVRFRVVSFNDDFLAYIITARDFEWYACHLFTMKSMQKLLQKSMSNMIMETSNLQYVEGSHKIQLLAAIKKWISRVFPDLQMPGIELSQGK